MAKDNKSIGKFRLKGIKRAPAGVPQIEVTFDIDANGILKVSARDMDTQKAQSIVISADDRMSDAEIEQAMRDARDYAATDHIRRDALEVRDEAQRLASQVQNTLKTQKKMDKAKKKQIKSDLAKLQKLLMKLKVDKVSQAEVLELTEAKEALKRSAEGVL